MFEKELVRVERYQEQRLGAVGILGTAHVKESDLCVHHLHGR